MVKIVRKTNAKIVISSSWRFSLFSKSLTEDGYIFWYLIKKYNLEVIGRTPSSNNGHRDREILAWLSEHEDEVDKFIILDDERYDLECFVGKELIQTSSVKKGRMIKGHWQENTGLRNKHVKQAIKILNS